jgi:hypothetical protein
MLNQIPEGVGGVDPDFDRISEVSECVWWDCEGLYGTEKSTLPAPRKVSRYSVMGRRPSLAGQSLFTPSVNSWPASHFYTDRWRGLIRLNENTIHQDMKLDIVKAEEFEFRRDDLDGKWKYGFTFKVGSNMLLWESLGRLVFVSGFAKEIER